MVWLLLVYKLSANSSTRRVYVWRRLKRVGAVYLQDGTCMLPANDRTREQFQWLAAEIQEMGGEACVYASEFLASEQETRVIGQFREQARAAYQQVLSDLERVAPRAGDRAEVEVALRDAWAAFGAARQVDFFAAPEGEQTLKWLRTMAGQIEDGHQEMKA